MTMSNSPAANWSLKTDVVSEALALMVSRRTMSSSIRPRTSSRIASRTTLRSRADARANTLSAISAKTSACAWQKRIPGWAKRMRSEEERVFPMYSTGQGTMRSSAARYSRICSAQPSVSPSLRSLWFQKFEPIELPNLGLRNPEFRSRTKY